MHGQGLFVDDHQQLLGPATGHRDVDGFGFGQLPLFPAIEAFVFAEDPNQSRVVPLDFGELSAGLAGAGGKCRFAHALAAHWASGELIGQAGPSSCLARTVINSSRTPNESPWA